MACVWLSKAYLLALLVVSNSVEARDVHAVIVTEAAASAAIGNPIAQNPHLHTVYDLGKTRPAGMKINLPAPHRLEKSVPNANFDKNDTRFAESEISYIDPVLTYQKSKSGPKFEVAALGGGMETAPFMAHVGLDWHF